MRLMFRSSGAGVMVGSQPAWQRCCATLPADHPQRARILDGYRKMMAGSAEVSGQRRHVAAAYRSRRGVARELRLRNVHLRDDHGREEWLAGRGHLWAGCSARAWIAVAGYIDQNDNITSVCEGTGKFNSLDYYLARKRRTGDFHGQAPVLWAASALLR